MSFSKKVTTADSTIANSGFGTNATNYGGRLLNKDGVPNIRKTGIGFMEKFSWFHSMLSVSGWRFFLIIFSFYIIVNLIFTAIYYLIGVEHLSGLIVHSPIDKFTEAFFFSAQTFTTVGYGRISPVGFLTSTVSAFQALIGLLSFAVATGLMYGRFSKPTAYLKFSGNALISPFKNEKALMIRVAPFKNTTLTDAEARLTIVITEEVNGKPINKFYIADLELSKINAFTLSWTLVHPINEESPLFGFSKESMASARGEIIVFIKAFDDMFSNTVVTRTSYTMQEIVFGAAFQPMFYGENNTTVLDISKLNTFESFSFDDENTVEDTKKASQ